MAQNEDHFKFFIEDDQTFEDYLKHVSKDGIWGGNLEIYVKLAYLIFLLGYFNEIHCQFLYSHI